MGDQNSGSQSGMALADALELVKLWQHVFTHAHPPTPVRAMAKRAGQQAQEGPLCLLTEDACWH